MQTQQINIFYFSGTGNTLLLLKAIHNTLKNKGFKITLYPIHNTDPKKLIPKHNDIWGFVFPVAFQGTYIFIWNFLEKLPKVPNNIKVYTFMADTFASFSGGVVGPLKKLLLAKNYIPLYAQEFKMPNNLLRKKITSQKDKKIITKSLAKVPDFINKIILALQTSKDLWPRIPGLSDFMNIFSRKKIFWDIARKLFKFNVDTPKCTKCRICINICPVKAIKINPIEAKTIKAYNNKLNHTHTTLTHSIATYPTWNMDKCIFCMRCISFCPTNAIRLNKKSYAQYKAVNLKTLIKWEKITIT